MKQDEYDFLIEMAGTRFTAAELLPHVVVMVRYDRALRLLARWHDRGWYEYDGWLENGQLTVAGRQAASRIARGMNPLDDP